MRRMKVAMLVTETCFCMKLNNSIVRTDGRLVATVGVK